MAFVLDKELREAEAMGLEMGPSAWEKWGPLCKDNRETRFKQFSLLGHHMEDGQH